MFTAALFTIFKTWKQLKCLLMDSIKKDSIKMDGIKKENTGVCVCVCVCVCDGILFSHKKKKKILPCAKTWMGLEGIMLAK